MLANQELNRKDIEIATLKSQNEQLRDELRIEKEVDDKMNKPSEAMKYFESMMKSPRKDKDTIGLGYSSTSEKGKSSDNGGKKVVRGKPICYHCGKKRTYNKCLQKQG